MMMLNMIKAVACFLLFLSLFIPIEGQSKSLSPQEFIVAMDEKVKNLLAANKWEELKVLITQSLEKEAIAKFVLNQHFKTMDPKVFEKFVDDYGAHLVNLYIDRLTQYNRGMYVVSCKELSSDRYLVGTRVSMNSGKEVEMSYFLVKHNGQYFVLDILIGGVRLIFTCRDEVQMSIEKMGMEGFLNEMSNRRASLQKSAFQELNARFMHPTCIFSSIL